MAAVKHTAGMDKDVQALMELQDKLNMQSGLQQMLGQQMQRTKIQHRRQELSLEQLADIAPDVAVYKQVGKAYLMEPMDQIRQELKDDMGRLSDEVKRLNQQQQHAAKTLAATEAEVQELFKSNPELARQLMPVSS